MRQTSGAETLRRAITALCALQAKDPSLPYLPELSSPVTLRRVWNLRRPATRVVPSHHSTPSYQSPQLKVLPTSITLAVRMSEHIRPELQGWSGRPRMAREARSMCTVTSYMRLMLRQNENRNARTLIDSFSFIEAQHTPNAFACNSDIDVSNPVQAALGISGTYSSNLTTPTHKHIVVMTNYSIPRPYSTAVTFGLG